MFSYNYKTVTIYWNWKQHVIKKSNMLIGILAKQNFLQVLINILKKLKISIQNLYCINFYHLLSRQLIYFMVFEITKPREEKI